MAGDWGELGEGEEEERKRMKGRRGREEKEEDERRRVTKKKKLDQYTGRVIVSIGLVRRRLFETSFSFPVFFTDTVSDQEKKARVGLQNSWNFLNWKLSINKN